MCRRLDPARSTFDLILVLRNRVSNHPSCIRTQGAGLICWNDLGLARVSEGISGSFSQDLVMRG